MSKMKANPTEGKMPEVESDNFKRRMPELATVNTQYQSGFTVLDVLIGTTILMTGVLALLGAMTSAVVVTSQSQQQLQAKQFCTSTMESIFSARDVGIATFAQVANTTTTGGIFLTGTVPIYNGTGPDGIIGTADDSYGPDGLPNTADDLKPVDQFQRQITITDISTPSTANNLRKITVTIFYKYSSLTFSQTMTSYMANYNTLNPGTSGN